MLDKFKRRFSERSEKDEPNYNGGTPEKTGFRSSAYLRHFEGYKEVTRIDERGRTVRERVYTGTYYEPDLSPSRRILLRLLYLLCFLGGAALFLFCSTRAAVCNTVIYVNVFQALSLPMFFWCVCALIFYVPFAGKLTVGEYNSQHKSLLRSTQCTALCAWAAALAAIVCLILHAGSNMVPSLLCTAGFALSGLLLFLIYLLESRLNYVTSDSKQNPS